MLDHAARAGRQSTAPRSMLCIVTLSTCTPLTSQYSHKSSLACIEANTNTPQHQHVQNAVTSHNAMQWQVGAASYIYKQTCKAEVSDPCCGQDESIIYTQHQRCSTPYVTAFFQCNEVELVFQTGQAESVQESASLWPDSLAVIQYRLLTPGGPSAQKTRLQKDT